MLLTAQSGLWVRKYKNNPANAITRKYKAAQPAIEMLKKLQVASAQSPDPHNKARATSCRW
jgi:hypothetical protein